MSPFKCVCSSVMSSKMNHPNVPAMFRVVDLRVTLCSTMNTLFECVVRKKKKLD